MGFSEIFGDYFVPWLIGDYLWGGGGLNMEPQKNVAQKKAKKNNTQIA